MKKIWVIISMFLVATGCEDNGVNTADNFDRSLLLTNVSEQYILPAYQDFVQKTTTLDANTQAFAASPSVETLGQAKTAWIAAAASWKFAEVFNFGPVDQLALQTQIDYWPTNNNGIENSINAYNATDNYLESIGSDKKGLPALEYLLFNGSEETVISGFINNENRKAYLLLLTDALKNNANKVNNEWKTNYAAIFVENTSNDANASITLLVNEMIALVEQIKNFKVANPLGKRTSTDPLPDQVESYYAGQSLLFIDKNIDAIEAVYTGGSGKGFDDYLESLNIEDDNGDQLSDVILEQINNCRSSLSKINDPLQEAVMEQPEAVEQLLIDLQLLTVSMKTDMISRLGLQIIFNDSDGD